MNNSVNHDLYRTFDPKHPNYQPYGCGRDMFIIHNDGGFIHNTPFPKGQGPKNPWKNPGLKGEQMVFGKLVNDAPSIYYPPDGSGRDTYIITNNGGTMRPLAGRNNSLNQSSYLRNGDFKTPFMDKRQTDKIPSMKTYDNWPSQHEILRNAELRERQCEQMKRLSISPKQQRSLADPVSSITHDYLVN